MLKITLAVSLLLATTQVGVATAKKRQLLREDRFLQTATPSSPPPIPASSSNNSSSLEMMPNVTMGEDGSGTSITYHKNLPCFSCIMSDNIFCVNAPDHDHVELGESQPASVCCDASDTKPCAQQFLPGWTCSNSYSDKLMSLRMCPFIHERCGNQSEIVFDTTG